MCTVFQTLPIKEVYSKIKILQIPKRTCIIRHSSSSEPYFKISTNSQPAGLHKTMNLRNHSVFIMRTV